MARVREVFSSITDSSLKAVIQEEAYKTIQLQLRAALSINPYSQPADTADTLENLGIITNPLAIEAHTHGAAKAIENDMYNIVANYLPKENPVTFYYMKKGKLGKFRRGPHQNDKFINSHFEPKDIARYPEETVVEHLEKTPCTTKLAFMGDTLHFWSPTQLLTLFKTSPTLKTLYATIVLPVEAINQLPSLHPTIYTLKYHGDFFMYLPGGHAGAAYTHHTKQLAWLLMGKLNDGDVTLTMQVLESKGANHLVIIQRGNFETPPLRVFGSDVPYVRMPKIFLPSQHNMNQPIPTVFAMKMFMYCKSLKEVTPRDIYAKMRQLLPDKELAKFSPNQIVHMMNYFFLIGKLDSVNTFEDVLSGSAVRRTFKPVIVWWQHFKQKLFGENDFLKLMKAVQWKPIDLTYKVEEFTEFSWRNFFLGKRVQPEPQDGDEDDFWDPKSYNPLDKGPEMTAEQLKAWDFLQQQKQGSSPSPEFHEDPLDPKSATQNTERAASEAAQETQPKGRGEEKTSQPPVEEQRSQSGGPEQGEASEASEASTSPAHFSTGEPFVTKHGVIIHRRDPDHDPETSWKDFVDRNLRFIDQVGKRQVTLYSRHSSIKTYSYGSVTHKAQPWPEALTAIAQAFNIPEEHDHCLVQRFKKSAAINYHADDEALILPGSQITTINLGHAELRTRRNSDGEVLFQALFGACSYIMPPGFQSNFKHAVASLEDGRISITFRTSVHHKTEDTLPWKAWVPILNAAGFKALDRQVNPNDGSLILPILDIQKLPKVQAACPGLQGVLKAIHREPTPFTPDPLRAKAFGSDVKNLRIGALLRHQSTEWLETFARKTEMEPRSVGLCVIHGTGGSGKSYALQDFLRNNPEERITIILPTNELRLDWVRKLPNAHPSTLKTHEKSLLAPASSTVIMDDYTKLPAGFIEAYINTNQGLETLILTGDPKQSFHHEPNDNAMTAKLAPFSEIAKNYCRYYLNATHRNKKDLANMLGVYSEVEGTTNITMSSSILPGRHLLVPSMYKKQAYGEMGHKVSTYAGCQGITAPEIQILIDSDTPMCSQQVMYTALSRAVHAIHFVNTGVTNDAFWEKLAATPYLAAFLRLVREEKTKEPTPTEDKATEPAGPATHFPVEDGKNFFDHITDNMPEKHERELHSNRDGFSNCVQTEDPVVQMFPHQQARDETLFWATIEARLKITEPEKNFEEFVSKRHIGDVLFENYKLAMGLPKEPIAFDEKLWEVCADEVQKTYLSKPLHMLKNGEGRQSPDFDPKLIALFLKSQWVKKVEKLGQPRIKAGQTIASFQQEAVMLYGTMARYMRRVREVFQPKNIMINCERTPEELSAWALENWNFKRNSYANDYTAFDQSQDGAMLQFEILKARHHSIPEVYIEGYLDLKCSSKTFLGILKIMRLTGEGPTFDANTECNIAFAHTKLKIPIGTAQLYAGDDCAFDFVPEDKPSFKKIETQMSLKAKPVIKRQIRGEWAEFCGMLITPLGVIKDPVKTWASLELAARRGELMNLRDSYERDVALAYQHKDRLHEIFSEEQSTAHQLTVRKIIRAKGGKVFASYD
nr:RNA-dependent RNA polymerase [Pitaya virus X]